MVTNQDYTFNAKFGRTDYGEITVPKGTRVTHRTATGEDPKYHYVDEFDWIFDNYPELYRTLGHDAMHYGINVPVEFVDKNGSI